MQVVLLYCRVIRLTVLPSQLLLGQILLEVLLLPVLLR